MNIPQGNGTFITSATGTNAGGAIIDGGSVTDASAWVSDTYSIQFTSPTTYEVYDSTATLVTSGTYTPNTSIAFNGIEVQLQGAPATGDSFGIAPSGLEDVFTTVNKLVTALGRSSDTTAQNALFATEMGAAIGQIDRAMERFSNVRSEVGARLSVLTDASDAQADRQLDLKASLSQIRDLDYAEALTTLNLQLAGLQAAQMSYAKINQLSLFNYL
jgi:flagellar hook-associated protein 3 FlgL